VATVQVHHIAETRRVGGAVNDGALAVCTSTSPFGFQTWKAILLS
jgi:hypothetical protein